MYTYVLGGHCCFSFLATTSVHRSKLTRNVPAGPDEARSSICNEGIAEPDGTKLVSPKEVQMSLGTCERKSWVPRCPDAHCLPS